MFPYITVFGKDISTYAVTAFIGAAVMCAVSVLYTKRRKKIPAEDIFYMLLYAGIGCLIGAKLLYLIISADISRQADKSFTENLSLLNRYLISGGFVFYGGLIGAFFGALRYCLHFKIPFCEAIKTVLPTVPLFHAFGRVGCFLSGCCYGKETASALGIVYRNSPSAPNGVALLPVQLFEAAGNLLLFILLTVLLLKDVRAEIMSGVYLMLYPLMRFILEFYRGDEIRGIFFGMSTSQWISIGLFTAGLMLIIRGARRRKSDI